MKRRIAIGDIHGCYKTLKNLLEEQLKITPEDHIYFVGDFIDRGPCSREVIDYLIDLQWQNFQIFPLRGNHEEMFLKAIEDEKYIHAWYNNGAEETLKSFDVPESLLFEYDGIKLIPEKYLRFISSLPYYFKLEDYIIVHAGINFQRDDIFEDKEAMVWQREGLYDKDKAEGKKVIHGHTPKPSVILEKNLKDKAATLINIDSGCVYKELPGYGNLTAYDLDSGKYFFQENID